MDLFRLAAARLSWSPRKPHEEEEDAPAAVAAAAEAAQQRRGVHWCEEVVVREIPNLAEYSKYDIDNLWWARDDFARFRQMYHSHAMRGFPDEEDQEDVLAGIDDYDWWHDAGPHQSYSSEWEHRGSGIGGGYGDGEPEGDSYVCCEDADGRLVFKSSAGATLARGRSYAEDSDDDTMYPSSGSECPSEDEGGENDDIGSPPAALGVRTLFDVMEQGAKGCGGGRLQSVPFGVPRASRSPVAADYPIFA